MVNKKFIGLGKRKTSIARVYLTPGDGKIVINKRELADYFIRPTSRMVVEHPLKLTQLVGKVNIDVRVNGGGLSGQAGAIRHGITRALLEYNAELRGDLKAAGLVTRDPRRKERKLYGQKGARARFQFSKR
jgi:small subunit ribosomal protein S9